MNFKGESSILIAQSILSVSRRSVARTLIEERKREDLMSFVCSFASAKIKSISIYRYLSSAVVFMLLPYVRTMHQYEIQRIVRPLVLESLFRASSLGSRFARYTERKRRIPRC